MKTKLTKKQVVNYIFRTIVVLLVAYLFFNSSARDMYSKFFQQRTLTSKISANQTENSLYVQRLSRLSNPDYFERAVREEKQYNDFTAPDEIEYRWE